MNDIAARIARIVRYLTGRESVDDVILKIRATTDSLLSGVRSMVVGLKNSATQLEDAKTAVNSEIDEFQSIIKIKRNQVKDLGTEVERFSKIATNIEKMFEMLDENSEESPEDSE